MLVHLTASRKSSGGVELNVTMLPQDTAMVAQCVVSSAFRWISVVNPVQCQRIHIKRSSELEFGVAGEDFGEIAASAHLWPQWGEIVRYPVGRS